MNDYVLSLLLGIIEGITEFLPVSSTAHLRIAQEILGIDLKSEYWKMFSIVIQLGAILSVVVYFWQRILNLVRTFPRGLRGKTAWWKHPLSLVMISFAVTAGPCLLIDKKIGANLENLWVIGFALLIGGVIMWIIDAFFDRPAIDSIESMTLTQAVLIGLAQILSAAFPGTSRSMSTIAAGQLVGLSRATSLEFSFFLSIPVMFAASGYKLVKYVSATPVAMSDREWTILSIGFITSFLVAWAVVAWFVNWVRRRGFVPFAIYRILAGLAVLLWRAWVWRM